MALINFNLTMDCNLALPPSHVPYSFPMFYGLRTYKCIVSVLEPFAGILANMAASAYTSI